MKQKTKRVIAIALCMLTLCSMVLFAGWLLRFQVAPEEPYFEGEAHLF